MKTLALWHRHLALLDMLQPTICYLDAEAVEIRASFYRLLYQGYSFTIYYASDTNGNIFITASRIGTGIVKQDNQRLLRFVIIA